MYSSCSCTASIGRTPQGCVDRNSIERHRSSWHRRRTPQGCVDRNCVYRQPIHNAASGRTPQGCVDRNLFGHNAEWATSGRTPQGCVDRNWHKIGIRSLQYCRTPQGCVDRNLHFNNLLTLRQRRTPQGCVDRNNLLCWARPNSMVAPRRGAWIEISLCNGVGRFGWSHPAGVRG